MIKVARDKKGFTLIELLIVVAIIGILAAVAIPAYTGYTQKARMSGVVNAMGAVKTAVATRYTENGGSFTTPNAVACADRATCETALSITIPATYLTDLSVAANGTITGTLANNIGSDVNGLTLVLTPDATATTWDWNASTVPTAYRPAS